MPTWYLFAGIAADTGKLRVGLPYKSFTPFCLVSCGTVWH